MRLAKRRAQMRWNSFVASPGSRLERLMLGRLGPALWANFVRHASLYSVQGRIDSRLPSSCPLVRGKRWEACPHNFRVDMSAPDAASLLECLHLDHEVKVSETCNVWHSRLPTDPISWDDGIDRDELGCVILAGGTGVSASDADGELGRSCPTRSTHTATSPDAGRVCF